MCIIGWHAGGRIHGFIRPGRLLNSGVKQLMTNGTVGFFHDRKGYGFIETDDSDDDIFFHMEDVSGPDLEEGTAVEFDIESSPKGPRAANVQRA